MEKNSSLQVLFYFFHFNDKVLVYISVIWDDVCISSWWLIFSELRTDSRHFLCMYFFVVFFFGLVSLYLCWNSINFNFQTVWCLLICTFMFLFQLPMFPRRFLMAGSYCFPSVSSLPLSCWPSGSDHRQSTFLPWQNRPEDLHRIHPRVDTRSTGQRWQQSTRVLPVYDIYWTETATVYHRQEILSVYDRCIRSSAGIAVGIAVCLRPLHSIVCQNCGQFMTAAFHRL